MAFDYDAVVIGAGLFGSLITRSLRADGHDVLALDSHRAGSGSKPAACLMKPGWFVDLGKNVYEPALKKLNELVGVQDLKFAVAKLDVTVHWCNPKRVLLGESEVSDYGATRIRQLTRGWAVETVNGLLSKTLETANVIVAAGVWTKLFNPEIDIVGQAGVAWLWPQQKIVQPRIKVWAPYKQLVAFNRGDGLWVSDGTSLRELDPVRQEQARLRCQRWAQGLEGGEFGPPKALFGYRPYVKDAKPCFLKQVRPGYWVATGGAKNGTLAAGWCADQITRALS